MLHVIVTGPECAGKTELSLALAAHRGGLRLPEYPRGYLQAAGRLAVLADFDHFAAVAERLLACAAAREPSCVIADTGFEVLRTWAQDKFGAVPAAIESGWAAQRPDAYVLCRPDLPWEYDALRQDPHRRRELFRGYRDLLAQTGAPVIEAKGRGAARVREVAKFVAALTPGRQEWNEA